MPKNGGKSNKMSEISKKYVPAVFCICAALMLLFCGCRSDRFHQNRAVDEARSFLLKNAPELSPAQVAYVKYNDPFFLTGNGLEGKVTGIKQVCIVWDIPDAGQLYMVFGASRERMDNWTANRLIRKNYVKSSPHITSAVAACRTFAVTNYLETLSNSDLNIIRFSNPEICLTSFASRSGKSIHNPNDLSLNKFDEVITLKTPSANAVQISLLWKISDNNYAVFCGEAVNESLAGWNLNFAGIMPENEAKPAISRTLKEPGSYNTPVPEKTAAKVEK